MDSTKTGLIEGQIRRTRAQPSYLFYKLNASKQIHAEIYKLPDDPLSGVLFLLQHEHVMVEELLKLLIREVNAELLKAVILAKIKKISLREIERGSTGST